MKLCIDCKHFRDQRRGICNYRKITTDPVRGSYSPAFVSCELERVAGECGLDAVHFVARQSCADRVGGGSNA